MRKQATKSSAPAKPSVRRRLTYAEWKALGERLYGPDMFQWRFVCPSCGHVQTPEDFRQFKDQGATPNSATFNCIGRYDGHLHVDMCSGKSPCNYTTGGLFNISPYTVLREDGMESSAFAFADDTGD